MSNRILRSLVACAVALLLGAPLTAGAQVSAVAAPGRSMTAAQVAEVFAGVVTTWPDGTRIQIIENADAAVAREFYQKVVRKPQPIAKAQLTKLALSGQGLAPKRAANDAEVLELVKKTPGGIGFVLSASVDGSVAELHKAP